MTYQDFDKCLAGQSGWFLFLLVSPDSTLSRPTSTASSAQLSFRQFTNSDHIQQLNANERLNLANHLAQVSQNQMV